MAPDPASGPSKDSDSADRQQLPFEPVKKKSAKAEKPPVSKAQVAKAQVAKAQAAKSQPAPAAKRSAASIPDVVSRRMVKRVAVFCGIPTALGMSTFIISYFVVTQLGIKLPTYAVLLVSLGWFGLGVLGLSYGLLSASWDEDREGNAWGWDEFKLNFGRMRAAGRANKPS